MMKILRYKGIDFDDYTNDEYGIWSQACGSCLEKHPNLKSISSQGEGACGVCGCTADDFDGKDISIYYLDFEPEVCEIVEVPERRVKQISLDIEALENSDGNNIAEEISRIIEQHSDFKVLGHDFSADLTDIYKSDYHWE